MELAAKYDPQAVEDKWYRYWMDNRLFHSEPDGRPAYSIVIPPPNVTGVLHMGHMLNNTIQDILVRRARMQGFNAVWVPGTDHASIATEAKVVHYLKEKGIEKKDLTREQFLEYAWEWKEKHGGIILRQLQKLGASCDWDRTKFTMDADLSEAVIDIFVDLFNKGKIYRGVRMVNWDPKALTAVSDEEVVFKELQSKLYYVRYQIEGEPGEYVTIATTRPETILGDTAICMHPEDERYAKYKGKRAIVPVVNRSVPLIYDEYVDREFGTGALKITPAHDINDYNLGIKHHLETINIFNDNGTLNEQAGYLVGLDRFEARKAIIPLLKEAGSLVKIEDYVNKVGFSERTNEVVEPKLSMQWFCKMDELAKPALDAVMKNEIRFFPDKFKNTYAHWMENIKDWCISRQLWWGHRIPAYYLPNHEMVVAHNLGKALSLAQQRFPELNLSKEDLKQDEDVMDTWFSSWLWPLSVFDGIRHPDNPEINYYYPTATLITAPDIIFFWVARMIMAGLEWRGMIPFKDVYFTGTVRDKLRRKMSKSLGNSPDPILLIEKYGADGVRFGMLHSSPAGNDLLFDESLCEQGRNFSNKIWNAFRLVMGWNIDETLPQPAHSAVAVKWMKERINEVIADMEEDFKIYKLSEALISVYKLIWDDFCSCLLEIVKPGYQQPVDRKTFDDLVDLFETLMTILHPFMPFITEELWHSMRQREEGTSVMTEVMPVPTPLDRPLLDRFAHVRSVVESIRHIRSEKNIAVKNTLSLRVHGSKSGDGDSTDAVICKLANVDKIEYIPEDMEISCVSFIVQNIKYSVPVEGLVSAAEELKKLQADLRYAEGFLQGVMKKLSNERFVQSAPANVVENERKKQADAEQRIRILKDQIAKLS